MPSDDSKGYTRWCTRGAWVIIPTYILLGQSQWMSSLIVLTWWSTFPALSVFSLVWHSLLVFMSLWSHWMSLFTDPGRVPILKDDQIKEDALRFGFTECAKCQSIRPRRAHHCKVCRRCILHMDHHCPWIGNCVGLFNQKFFIQYNAYIMILGVTDIVLSTAVVCDMYRLYMQNVDIFTTKYGIPFILFMVLFYVLAILFTLFTFTLLVDQLRCIYRNVSAIDEFKGIKPHRKPFKQSLTAVFGCPPSLKWLLPLRMRPRFLSDPLTAADLVALSVFDEGSSLMTDHNHELQGITGVAGVNVAHRRCSLIKCISRGEVADRTDNV